MRKIYPDFPYTDLQLKWLKILEGKSRSFKPNQACNALRVSGSDGDDGFCCLGVATEMISRLGIIKIDWHTPVNEDTESDNIPVGENYTAMVDGHTCIEEVLDDMLAVELDLRSSSGEGYALNIRQDEADWPIEVTVPTLYMMNDEGSSFKTIARVIRMFPHFYFRNGGEPTMKIYRDDMLRDDFDVFTHRACYFKD